MADSSPSLKMNLRPGPVILHSLAAAVMAWGYTQLGHTIANDWIEKQKGGHFQFLTIQGLAVAWLTMMFSLAADLLPASQTLRRIKRTLFMLALPLAVVISTIYWTLMIFLPEMILMPSPHFTEPSSSTAIPKLLRLPLPMDLALHAVPGISLVLDFIWFERKYGKTEVKWGAPLLTAMAAIWYASWVEHCASVNGVFPYPFLTTNPFPIRVCIYLAASKLALVSFWMLNALHP